MKLKLPDITLVTATSVRVSEHLRAIEKCRKNIDFGNVIFVSHEKPSYFPEDIEFMQYPKIETIMDFNYLMWEDIGWMIDTPFALFCQDHGYVLDHRLWRDEFLNYDFIGSPWEIRENSYTANTGEKVRVGNGGFSIRSQKLMRLPRQRGWELRQEHGFYNEDGNYCCYYRKEFLEEGIKYAPLELAIHFAYETPIPENQGVPSFGFHRFMNPANKVKTIFNSVTTF